MENENESNQILAPESLEQESALTVTEAEAPKAQNFKLEAQDPATDQQQGAPEGMEVDEVADSINAQKVQVAE